jgi:hypothetical protein
MSINLLEIKTIVTEIPPCVSYTGTPAFDLLAWLAIYEAGIHDPNPVEGEPGRILLTEARYDVDEGLVITAWGKHYRLRVTAEPLD